jgi:hypothetical protein
MEATETLSKVQEFALKGLSYVPDSILCISILAGCIAFSKIKYASLLLLK